MTSSAFECFALCEGTWDPMNPVPGESYPEVKRNYISDELKLFAYICVCIAVVLCAGIFMWIIIAKENIVIRASQPFFLMLVLCGSLLSILAIFFIVHDYDEGERKGSGRCG